MGIGGKILSPEDFVVTENIQKKFLQRFERSGTGVAAQKGYFLYKLKKRGITTKDAVRQIARRLRQPISNIGYAGLKDKFACTEQYITIKQDVENIKTDLFSVEKIKPTNKFIGIGDLISNDFSITLHNVKFNAAIFNEIKKNKMPNFFGPQRFGNNQNNQIIGKMLVKRELSRALTLIKKNSGKKYRRIDEVEKKALKFYIHAYQSWIFNKAVIVALRQKKKIGEIKIPGCNTVLGKSYADSLISEIMKQEHITTSDFSIRELKISCTGDQRKAFIKVPNIKYFLNGHALTMQFMLPKGSYATVLINEIAK